MRTRLETSISARDSLGSGSKCFIDAFEPVAGRSLTWLLIMHLSLLGSLPTADLSQYLGGSGPEHPRAPGHAEALVCFEPCGIGKDGFRKAGSTENSQVPCSQEPDC